MNQVKKAARELVKAMEQRGQTKAVFYSFAGITGFHPIIAVSQTKALLDVEGDIRMVIEEIDIDVLRAIGIS